MKYSENSTVDNTSARILFRRDASFQVMRQGGIYHGVRVVSALGAARPQLKEWRGGVSRTAEVFVKADGYTLNGGPLFIAEFWLH